MLALLRKPIPFEGIGFMTIGQSKDHVNSDQSIEKAEVFRQDFVDIVSQLYQLYPYT